MYKNKLFSTAVLVSLFCQVLTVSVTAVNNDLNTDVSTIEMTDQVIQNDIFSNPTTDVLNNIADVATDPDLGRVDFDNELDNPTPPKTPTTVTVEAADQITNLEKYREQAKSNNTYAAVDSWTSLKNVYTNQSISFIEIIGDFSAPANVSIRDLGWRVNDIIIDGGGHTVDMDRAGLNVGTSATKRNSVFTITNIDLIHWQSGTASGNTNDVDGVIDTRNAAGGYGYWSFNIDNVTVQGPDGEGGVANRQPRRLLDAEDSLVKLSGTVKASAKQELMQIGQVEIVNDSTVELQRTAGTTGYSMFYFMAVRANNAADTGFAHTFTAGDGVSIKASELSTYNSNTYPLIYYGYNGITVGDNVTWHQDGFQMLLDLNRYVGTKRDNRSVTFGQNLKMTALRTVGRDSIYAAYRSNITFNAGTELDLQQWNNNPVVNMTANSSVTFVSPKSLHISRNSNSGTPVAGGIFTGSGTFSMNNSEISSWQGTSSKETNPAGNRNARFSKLAVSGNNTTLTDTGGNSSSSNIIDNSTRELSTNSIDPGTIKLNYLDQYGEKLKTVDYPIDNNLNYIGQFLPIRTKLYADTEIPDYYKFALAKQVPNSAIADAQSGGDPTSSADNGDAYGQAELAIVPMENTEYVYNIYVYGDPNTDIKYQYKDLKSGNILKDEFVNSKKEEAGSPLVPANYGNKIDWTNKYYTHTNLPQGYHYATASELDGNVQPTNTSVGLTPETTTLYAYPDKQTVIVTFKNSDGSPLVDQESPISIDGYSGQEISYKDLVEGKVTEPKVSPEKGTFTFDYTDNKDSTTDKELQYLTIELSFVKVNMTVKQVYKAKNEQFIYKDLDSQTIVDNTSNVYDETIIGDELSDIIDSLKAKNDSEIKIDYDWYLPIDSSKDYIVMVNGTKVNTDTVPDDDFELLIVYTGISAIEIPDLNYGNIFTTNTEDTRYDNPNLTQKATVLNTDITYNWDLVVSMKRKITKSGTTENYLGGLLFKKNGVDTVLNDSGVIFSSKSEQSNQLKSEIPMDIKLFQNIGNNVGKYDGELTWILDNTP